MNRQFSRLWMIGTVFLLLLLGTPLFAQDDGQIQVFLTHGMGSDRLTFVNLLSGEEQTTVVDGDHYTVTNQGVIYLGDDRQVMLAAPGERSRPHPFITMPENGERIDWALSPDGEIIAWTITSAAGGGLITETWLADVNGIEQPRLVLSDGPRAGIRAYPLTFSPDSLTLYMDFQPHVIADLTPFRQFAALFALDLQSGAIESLPGEAGCYCGADIRGDHFFRMGLAERGFNVRSYDLSDMDSGAVAIDGLGFADYTLGGDLLISPDGNRAIYALARPVAAANGALEMIFILVDTRTRAQEQLTEPQIAAYRPSAWLDQRTILLTSTESNGTWSLDTRTGEISQIASATYLGAIPIASSSAE